MASQHLPDDGITIFGSFLHSHLIGEYRHGPAYYVTYKTNKTNYLTSCMLLTIGRALTVRHFRKTSQCKAVEELEPIDENLSYDFDFQARILSNT